MRRRPQPASREDLQRALDGRIEPDDLMREYLFYVIFPLWLAAGLGDYITHRISKIEETAGPTESLLHSFMLLLSDVQARNPDLSREDLEQVFADYLGATKTLWLNKGIAGDDTHGHVDDLARFTDATTVVVCCENHRSDENYEPLMENYRRLQRMTDQNGNPLRVVKLPMPEPVWFENRRLPASYANFYIANKRVLVPVFNSANDLPALNTLQQLFPSRRVVPIYCGDFIWGLGAIHCMTQQQPA